MSSNEDQTGGAAPVEGPVAMEIRERLQAVFEPVELVVVDVFAFLALELIFLVEILFLEFAVVLEVIVHLVFVLLLVLALVRLLFLFVFVVLVRVRILVRFDFVLVPLPERTCVRINGQGKLDQWVIALGYGFDADALPPGMPAP